MLSSDPPITVFNRSDKCTQVYEKPCAESIELLQSKIYKAFSTRLLQTGLPIRLFKRHRSKIFFRKPRKKSFNLVKPHVHRGRPSGHAIMQQNNVIRPDFPQYPVSQPLDAAIAGIKAAAAEGDDTAGPVVLKRFPVSDW